ncbi:hypothetical protein PybrP1_005573 [[Pythium] brassicae (nom. inval.)]|nr:hypothetical protein PybrP1_005573 [[Pythium] brassicae (nom. inval.)]
MVGSTSSLAAQLQQLREGGAGSKQKTDTFLYDPREAARVDNETVFNLAWNGLLELKRLDARFEALDTSADVAQLFSRQRVHFHRAHASKSEDAALDAALGKVLDALSAYFLLGATHKVLEFLVRRYQVHRYNVDAVMAAIVSFHESPWFARMVRILHIRGTRWEFLLQVKQSGEPLLRAALVQRALDDSSIVDFVFATAARLGAANPKLVSLYTLLTLQMLEQATVREATLRTLIPQLLNALKSGASCPELQSAAFMLVTKLASKALLTAKVVDTLAKHLVKYAQPGAQMNALLCVIFVAQAQPSFQLSRGVGKYLLAIDNVVDLLADAVQQYEAAKFVRALALFLADALAADGDASHALLMSLIAALTLSDNLVEELVAALLRLAQAEGFALESARVQAAASVLVALSKRHVNTVDAVVHATLAAKEKTKKEAKRVTQFLAQTFGGVANSAHFLPSATDATTSLALALEHPTESTRYQAVVALAKQQTADSAPALTNGGVLLRRLLDDSERVAKFVVTSVLGDLVLRTTSKRRCWDALVQVVRKWAAAPPNSVLDAVLSFAVTKFRAAHGGGGDASDDEPLLMLLLPFVPTDTSSAKIKAAVSVAALCDLVGKLEHPFGACVAKTERTAPQLIDALGATLASNVKQLLPFALSWSQPSDVAVEPLTGLLVRVLQAARQHLVATATGGSNGSKKSSATDLAALEQALRFVLKKEFVAMCEQPNATDAATQWAVAVAAILSDVVGRDTFLASRDDFDACVATLLQAPSAVFLHVQGSLLALFEGAMERELLPTMARLATAPSSDVMARLVKTRALDIVSAVLEGYQYTESAAELALAAHAVPSVLVALADPAASVRQSALACLDRWVASSSGPVLRAPSADLHTLLKVGVYFVHAKQDIAMDARAVSALCGTYAAAAPTESAAFYQLLMRYVSSAAQDELVTARKLLGLLAHVKDAAFWLQSVEYFHQTLAGLVSGSVESVDATTAVLSALLGFYLDADVATMTTTAAKTTTLATKTTAVHKPFFDALLAVLQCEAQPLARLQPLQALALSQLSPALYRALDDVSRYVLVAQLLKLLVVAEEAVAGKLVTCVTALPVSYELFIKLLDTELVGVGKASAKSRAAPMSEAVFQNLNCVLEVLAVKVDGSVASSSSSSDSEESAAAASALLKTLCDVLALFCAKENERIVSEYILQVLFGCLRRVCEVSSSLLPTAVASKRTAAAGAVEVEPERLVKHTLGCLSRTASPQTRNEALLFVSALVHLFPASVLASLEKILSFVGAGSIHHEDAYSFHVLETIVKAVVPHIVAATQPGLITLQQFVRIFVDAYERIPSSRRELLFAMLVAALGRDSLPYCVAALLEKAAAAGAAETCKELTAFAHSVCFAFGCTTQLATLVSVLQIARSLLPHVMDDADTDNDDVDDDDDDDSSADRRAGAYGPFVFGAHVTQDKRRARALNAALVAFVPTHLKARELHHKILSLQNRSSRAVAGDSDDDNDEVEEESESEQLQQSYLMLAQVVLLYFRRVAREEALVRAGDAESTFWTALSAEIVEVLSALQKLLSTPGFVAVISELLHHDNSLVRKKAMQLFNERLAEERDALSPGEQLLFVDMLDELDAILQNADGSETMVNVQTALLSVDILARSFAAGHAKRFQQSLPTIVAKYVDAVDPARASPTALHLFGCAFVCVSSICRAVGPLVFPLLPKFYPKLLVGVDWCASKVKPAKGEDRGAASGMATVLQCLLAALEVFAEQIAPFLAPYLARTVQVLLSPSLLAAGAANAPLQLAVDSSLAHLSNRVELRHLLPSVFGAYEFVLAQGSDASVEKLFTLVAGVVAALDVAALRQHLPAFARFFVTALDARRVHAAKLQDVDAAEDEILDCLVQFVLRLSEKQLKPLFLKIAEWSQAAVGGGAAHHTPTKHGDLARRIVFAKLVVKLSERLRGIFVPYFAHVLEVLTTGLRDAHDVLTRRSKTGDNNDDDSDDDNDDSDDDDFFSRDDAPATKKPKLANGSRAAASVATAQTRASYALLLRTTVRALNGCFVHDSDGFMEKERFDLVLEPLVDVFDVLKRDASAATRAFVLDVVAPCLANLAWAAKSDLLWKPLHYAVLMKSRSPAPGVRLAALKTIEQCYQVIGDEFLAMLPESIPFLAELMEDTDAEVERTCHQVVKQIEDISGESLDQYLTS